MTARASRVVVPARTAGGGSRDHARTVRVVRDVGGETVRVALGGRNPDRAAYAAATLDADHARDLARALLAAADDADAARGEAILARHPALFADAEVTS